MSSKLEKKTQLYIHVCTALKTCLVIHLYNWSLSDIPPISNIPVWDIKQTDNRRVDKKAELWEDQAKAKGKTVEHLQGWFKSLRDTHTRLDKKKSGDGAPKLAEREQREKAKTHM